jgi:hypothetical protein
LACGYERPGRSRRGRRARSSPSGGYAPFAATVDTEPASFRSLLALVGGDDQIALFTTEEIQPPSAFLVVRRDSVDEMVLEDAGACTAQPGAPIVSLGVADGPEMLGLASVTEPGPFGPRTIELGHYIGIRRQGALVAMAGERIRLDGCAWNRRIEDTVSQPSSSDRWLRR